MCCVNRQMGSSDLKNVSTYPPPPLQRIHFLKRPFLRDFKKYTDDFPYVLTCLHIGAKIAKKKPKSAKMHKIGT